MYIKKLSYFFLVLAFGIISSCDTTSRNFGGILNNTEDSSGSVVENVNASNDITAFSVLGVAGTITGSNIVVTVPYSTVVTSLTPTIIHTGVSVSPASGVAQDFTNAIIYTVTAADYSTKDYTVTVVKQPYVLRGSGPAGGFIFYDQGNWTGGWRYLEAAPIDQSTGVAWSNVTTPGTFLGTTSSAIGKGQSNTTAIISQTSSSAAKLCKNQVIGGYSDWFLPSKDELNKMYTELKLYGVGGFTNIDYWSSSEYDATYVWAQYFSTGLQYGNVKYDLIYVRCIRAF